MIKVIGVIQCLSHVWLSVTLWIVAMAGFPSIYPGVSSNSCPLSWWCYPTISFCYTLLLLSSIFPSITSGSFSMSQLFTSDSQSIRASSSSNSPSSKNSGLRLPWWSSGKESSLQCREHRFDPWSRKIPHATWQQSQCATTTEPLHPRACSPQKEKPPQWEACAPQLESSLHHCN